MRAWKVVSLGDPQTDTENPFGSSTAPRTRRSSTTSLHPRRQHRGTGGTAGYHPLSGERGGAGGAFSTAGGSPRERWSSSSVMPARSWDRLSRSATATRISVFVVIRSPAPLRFLLSTRARIDSCVIWSDQISSSLRSRRRYFGRPGTSARAGASGLRPAARPSAGLPPESVLPYSVPLESVVPESVCPQVTRPGAQAAAAAGRWRGHGRRATPPQRRYRSFAPGLERLRRAPGRRRRLSHEVTDFRSSPSVVPRSLPARPRSMSTATRISVFSVIRSPSPPRWRLRVRRILASSSSWSARSRSSLRSRRCHLGIRDSITPAVPAFRGPRATRRGAGRRGSGFSTAAAGAASAGASLGGTTGGAAGGAWSTSPSKSATLCRGISSRPSRPRSGRGRAAARYARA